MSLSTTVKLLTGAAAAYATIAVYGVLRTADIPVLVSTIICIMYSVGFYNIVMFSARDLLGME